MTDKYAVIGNPISHSKSPQIHAAFAKQTGQDLRYEAILSPLDGFAVSVKSLIAQGYKGANVTVPFKFEAFNLCDALSERAEAAGAVNTLTFEHGKIKGDNTDGAGLVSDIVDNLKVGLQNKRLLLLGAGGAAQGVLLPLIAQNPASILIANRNLEKAQNLVAHFAQNAVCNMVACDFATLKQPFLQQPFDVVINATSASLQDASLPIGDEVFTNKTMAYDMMYGRETPFMAQARANGAQVTDGLGMLVEQAAEAFFVWRGVRPDTQAVLVALREKLAFENR